MNDLERKKLLGYKDKRSKVRFDGAETLVGADWMKRKKELWDRAAGRCERMIEHHPDVRISLSCTVRCPNDAQDPHHIKPRSKGRDDRLSNLLALCRMHHDLVDKRKVQWTKKENKHEEVYT